MCEGRKYLINNNFDCIRSIVPRPVDFELFRFLTIFRTSSWLTGLNLKEHFLFFIEFFRCLRGSFFFGGSFFCKFFTFLMKKLFMVLAISLGLIIIFSTKSWVGGPEFFHPSQLFTFCHKSVELLPRWSSCFFSH